MAKQVAAAKKMIAAAHAADAAAEKSGVPLTYADLKKLGYIETEGGVWELPIPLEVCKVIVAEDDQIQPFKEPAEPKFSKAAKRRLTTSPTENDCRHHSRGILKRGVIQCTNCRKVLRRVGDTFVEITFEELGPGFWRDKFGWVRLPSERCEE